MAELKIAQACEVFACEQNVFGHKSFCRKHYNRWKKYNDPLRVKFQHDWNDLTFWQSAALTADDNRCWNWEGPVTRWGYGFFTQNRKRLAAHRHALYLATGTMKDLMVMHLCDNRLCVNPRHLQWGTAKDNNQDMYNKKRHSYGSKHSVRGLTDDIVLSIRADNRLQKVIAHEYNVTRSCIGLIKRGKTWKHLL